VGVPPGGGGIFDRTLLTRGASGRLLRLSRKKNGRNDGWEICAISVVRRRAPVCKAYLQTYMRWVSEAARGAQKVRVDVFAKCSLLTPTKHFRARGSANSLMRTNSINSLDYDNTCRIKIWYSIRGPCIDRS
jgi:hypothetical protein